jgi:hypothetical protein
MSPANDEPAATTPQYERFEDEETFQQAVDRLLGQPGRELRIFDPDLAGLRLNMPERRIYIAIHDTGYLSKYCPRMRDLLARYAHAIQVQQTDEEIREVQDAFLVLDANHYVRRPVARFWRGAIGIGDESEALSMRARFFEIWAASYPAVSPTTLGL